MTDFEKKQYIDLLIKNLVPLRKMAGLTQEELGCRLGISRQRLIGYEKGSRGLAWNSFLAFFLVFSCMDETKPLLRAMGIDTRELRSYLKTGR